ncbi:MAG: hypothetical protein EA001_03190 [Oscillatoriales cyanobacterium]|nr:MAG: hypothetical protein EA001_03190 [Oscillatoriales cyanobacterium]
MLHPKTLGKFGTHGKGVLTEPAIVPLGGSGGVKRRPLTKLRKRGEGKPLTKSTDQQSVCYKGLFVTRLDHKRL